MKEFLAFLSEYKELLVSFVCLVATILCIVLKRKPKTLDEFNSCLIEVLNHIPEFVIQVEKEGHGYEKKINVMNLCKNRLQKELGRELSEKEIELVDRLSSNEIELVLSTPRKKDIIL